MWAYGIIKGYIYEATVCATGRAYGINGGRISKLQIHDREDHRVVNYDRGWNVKPKDDTAKAICAEVIRRYQ